MTQRILSNYSNNSQQDFSNMAFNEDINSYAATLLKPEMYTGASMPSLVPDARVAKTTTVNYDYTTSAALSAGMMLITWHNNSIRYRIFDYLNNPGVGLPVGNYLRDVVNESEDISESYTKGNLVSGVCTAVSSAVSGSQFSLAGKWFVGQFDSLPDLITANPDNLPGMSSVAGGQRTGIPISKGVAALALPLQNFQPRCYRSPFKLTNYASGFFPINHNCSSTGIFIGNPGTFGFASSLTDPIIWSSANAGGNIPANFSGRVRMTANFTFTLAVAAATNVTFVAEGLVSNKDGTGFIATTTIQVLRTQSQLISTVNATADLEFPWMLRTLKVVLSNAPISISASPSVNVTFLSSEQDGYLGPCSIISWSGCVSGQQLLFSGTMNYYLTPNASLTRQVSPMIDDSQVDDMLQAHHFLSWLQARGMAGAYTLEEYESTNYMNMALSRLDRNTLRGTASGFGMVMSALGSKVLPYVKKFGGKAATCIKSAAKSTIQDAWNGGSASSFDSDFSLAVSEELPTDVTTLLKERGLDPENNHFGSFPDFVTFIGFLQHLQCEANKEVTNVRVDPSDYEEITRLLHVYFDTVNEVHRNAALARLKSDASVDQREMDPKSPWSHRFIETAPFDQLGRAILPTNDRGLQRWLKNKTFHCSPYTEAPQPDGGSASSRDSKTSRFDSRFAPRGNAPVVIQVRNDAGVSVLDSEVTWLQKKESSETIVARNGFTQRGSRMPFDAGRDAITANGFYIVVRNGGNVTSVLTGYIVLSKMPIDRRPTEDFQRGSLIDYTSVDFSDDSVEVQYSFMRISGWSGKMHVDNRIDALAYTMLTALNISDDYTGDLWLVRVEEAELVRGNSWTLAMLQTLKNMPAFNFYSGEVEAPDNDHLMQGFKLYAVADINYKMTIAPLQAHRSFFAVTDLPDSDVVPLYEMAQNIITQRKPDISSRPTLPILSQNITCSNNPYNFISSIEQADQTLLFCKEKMNAPPMLNSGMEDLDVFFTEDGLRFLELKLGEPAFSQYVEKMKDGRWEGLTAGQVNMLNGMAKNFSTKGGLQKAANAGQVQGNGPSRFFVGDQSTNWYPIYWEDVLKVLNDHSMFERPPSQYASHIAALRQYRDKAEVPPRSIKSGRQVAMSHPPARIALNALVESRQRNPPQEDQWGPAEGQGGGRGGKGREEAKSAKPGKSGLTTADFNL